MAMYRRFGPVRANVRPVGCKDLLALPVRKNLNFAA